VDESELIDAVEAGDQEKLKENHLNDSEIHYLLELYK